MSLDENSQIRLAKVLLWFIFIIAFVTILVVVHQIDQLGIGHKTGNPVDAGLANVLLWFIFIVASYAIPVVVHQMHQLGHGDQETGHPVEEEDHDDLNGEQNLPYPIQETQEPGVHPSMRFSSQIQVELGGDSLQQDRAPDVSHANPERLENADSSRVVGNNSELCSAEKKDSNKKQVNDVQPSPVPITEEPQSAEFSSFNRSNVPGDVDQSTNPPEATDAQPASYQQASASGINTTTFGSSSNPKPPEATDAKPISDQQASTSGMNATAFGSCANLNKKRKGKKKKKKKKKSKSKSTAYTEGSSSDDAPSDDPNASTDESHHSSIETFSSGFDEKTKIQ